MKIEELEKLIEQCLRGPLQDLPGFRGSQPKVTLLDGQTGRKKKANAEAANWSPESGEIRISFEPQSTPPARERPSFDASSTGPEPHGGRTEAEFRPAEIRGEPLSATILRERR